MKKNTKRDLLLILAIVILAVGLMVYGLSSRKAVSAPSVSGQSAGDALAVTQTENTDTPADTPEAVESAEQAAETNSEAAEKAAAYLETYPAESYLVVTTANGMYNPIPLTEETSFRVNFGDGEYNQIHIGKNSAYMESSSCDNQNCVGEGEVTLENRDTRILFNMILCLPHDLSLELIDAEEALEYMTEFYEAQALYEAMMAEYAAAQADGEVTQNVG